MNIESVLIIIILGVVSLAIVDLGLLYLILEVRERLNPVLSSYEWNNEVLKTHAMQVKELEYRHHLEINRLITKTDNLESTLKKLIIVIKQNENK